MKRVILTNPRYKEYNQYLDQHIASVQRAWKEILKPALAYNADVIDITAEDFDMIDRLVEKHDSSKYGADEYVPYCNYFYPCDGFEKSQIAFDNAWLKHQHRNPHHPQYWVLIRDEGDLEPLDMPIPYICEMLCDWHSFSLRDPESTAYNWWRANKQNILLSAATADIVEAVIDFLKSPLAQLEE